jgi:hypothetical protein
MQAQRAMQPQPQQPVSYPTMGDRMAQQQQGIQNFNDGIQEDHALGNKLFAENMLAVGAVMAGVRVWQQRRANDIATNANALANATPEQAAGVNALAAQKKSHWYSRRPTADWVMPDGSIVKVRL